MNYLFGSGAILKDKISHLSFEFQNVQRIFPKKSFLEQYMYFYSEPTEILPNLYLGSAFNAYDLDFLQKNQITVILNITKEISNYYEQDPQFLYYKFPILDNDLDDITPILLNSYKLLDYHLSQGDKVLVHCYMGASRSASVIIYFLMKNLKKPFHHILHILRKKRSIINLSNCITKSISNLHSLEWEVQDW